MSELENLQRRAAAVGLALTTYSPGDGVTRYRFASADRPGSDDYFAAPSSAIVSTELGRAKAKKFLNAYIAARHLGEGRTRGRTTSRVARRAGKR